MNAPFKLDSPKRPFVDEVLATAIVSISDLKKNPAAVVAEAGRRQVAILNRNRPVAYVISPLVWEHLCDLVADRRLAEDAEEELRAIERGESETVEIDLDHYL
jgi:antitoxin StbD